MIPVCRVGQGALFGNDADGGFMGSDDNAVNFIEPVLSEYRLHADNATSAVETHMLAALEVMARH